jgi:Spy/CpxP family protein refolding chaperone
MKHLLIVLAIVALLPAPLFAQRGRGMGGARGGGGRNVPIDAHTALLVFTALLNLTDAQQQQIGGAFDAAVKDAAPLNAQIENGKQAIFDAVKSGKSPDEIKTLTDREGALGSELSALQVQTFAKMCAFLTSDQKAQVDPSMFMEISEFLANAREPIPQPALPGSAPPASTAPPVTGTPPAAPQQ